LINGLSNKLFLNLIALYSISVWPCLAQETLTQESKPRAELKETREIEKKLSTIQPIESKGYWMHSFHETVSESVYQSAYWFDNFFTDDDSEQRDPKTNARVRLSWEPKSRDFSEFKTRFRVKVRLPHFSEKVDLIFADDAEDELDSLPLESSNTTPKINEEHFTAAFRFIHKKSNARLIDSRIGISGGDLFVRARLKRRFFWQDNHSFKFEPSVYYFLGDGLGEKVLLEYNYQYDQKAQFRVNYSIWGSQSFSGIRWKHGFYQLKQLSDNKASIFGMQIEGERNGERGFLVNKYTLGYRYRFNALEKWLFFEIEPFLEWPEVKNYKTTPGIALRVEGYFYKG